MTGNGDVTFISPPTQNLSHLQHAIIPVRFSIGRGVGRVPRTFIVTKLSLKKPQELTCVFQRDPFTTATLAAAGRAGIPDYMSTIATDDGEYSQMSAWTGDTRREADGIEAQPQANHVRVIRYLCLSSREGAEG
jgi:hypothetical protein